MCPLEEGAPTCGATPVIGRRKRPKDGGPPDDKPKVRHKLQGSEPGVLEVYARHPTREDMPPDRVARPACMGEGAPRDTPGLSVDAQGCQGMG